MNKDTGEHKFGPSASEIFTKVKEHLLRQGAPAKDRGVCMYRSPDGLKCAVGCLITDEAYDPAIEGKNVDHLAVRDVLIKSRIDLCHITLLKELQLIHDYDDPERWESLLEVFKP